MRIANQSDIDIIKTLVARGYTVEQIIGYTGRSSQIISYWLKKLHLTAPKEAELLEHITGDISTYYKRVREYAKQVGTYQECTSRKATAEELQALSNIKPIDRRREQIFERYVMQRQGGLYGVC